MSTLAQSAVFVTSSSAATAAIAALPAVHGPGSDAYGQQSGDASLAEVLRTYATLGFQATHYGEACRIAEKMLCAQPPSKIYKIENETMVEVQMPSMDNDDDEDSIKEKEKESELVFPHIFLGITANLLGTGCREAVRFLVQEGSVPRSSADSEDDVHSNNSDPTLCTPFINFKKLKREASSSDSNMCPSCEYRSFLSAVVVSGGGMEHDLRRACGSYTVSDYASEEKGTDSSSQQGQELAQASCSRFGNVMYARSASPMRENDALGVAASSNSLFEALMRALVRRLVDRQTVLKTAAEQRPIPEAYFDVCHWATTPSEVWALTGIWLVDLFKEALTAVTGASGSPDSIHEEALARAQSTVLYWAAKQEVPIYSPSFADGDIMTYILHHSSSSSNGLLKVDLVRDIHGINKLAMLSKRTGMLIAGGGVVKHHVCNANLMRNGADYTVLISNGQEFDGSDAGARLDEAVSWGKVRWDGESVKVYSEVSIVLPLLVAQVFVPAVRSRKQNAKEEHTSN